MSRTKQKSLPPEEAEARNLSLAQELAALCEEKRAEEILLLDMRRICSFADFFIIATANSQPQMKAIARDAEKHMHARKCRQLARHGIEQGRWVVLDYGDVIVHLFTPEDRIFYQIEELWGDAKRLDWDHPAPSATS